MEDMNDRAFTLFGDFFKATRIKTGLTLRKFCEKNGLDPVNISRIERGIAVPPSSYEKLEKYATFLGIEKDSDNWYDFFDLAATCSGKIPSSIMSDKNLINKLPAIFCTLRGQKVSDEKLRELSDQIRSI